MTDRASIPDTIDAIEELLAWHYNGYQGLPLEYVKDITDRLAPGLVTAWNAYHDAMKYMEELRKEPVTEDLDSE